MASKWFPHNMINDNAVREVSNLWYITCIDYSSDKTLILMHVMEQACKCKQESL